MRLTLRCVLASLRAVEASIDEIAGVLRSYPASRLQIAAPRIAKYLKFLGEARVGLVTARRALQDALDSMIDSGDGE